MPTPSTVPNLFGRMTVALGEHVTLLEEVRVLRELSKVLTERGRELRVDPLQVLDTFADHLVAHFAMEESPSYFGALIEEAPQLAARIERLREQHREMTLGLDELREMAGDLARRGEFAVMLGTLLDHLQRHEHAENLLLQEFFGQDEGSAGD